MIRFVSVKDVRPVDSQHLHLKVEGFGQITLQLVCPLPKSAKSASIVFVTYSRPLASAFVIQLLDYMTQL